MSNCEDFGLQNKIRVHLFLERIKLVINRYLYQAQPNSPASEEKTLLIDGSLIDDVAFRASFCFESACDHLMAYRDGFIPPVLTLAPFTCIRSLMESCSLAFWLLDTSISPQERLSRYFSFRVKEFREQIKFLRLDADKSTVEPLIQNYEKHLESIALEAENAGIEVRYKDGKINRIGTHFPSTIELIRYSLNREPDYRILSGVAHSFFWATHLFGFVRDDRIINNQTMKGFKKTITVEKIIFGIDIAIPAISKVFWEMSLYLGWDMKEVTEVMEANYDEFGFIPALKFWRSTAV